VRNGAAFAEFFRPSASRAATTTEHSGPRCLLARHVAASPHQPIRNGQLAASTFGKATVRAPCFTRRRIHIHTASIAYDNARDVPPCQSLSLRFGKGYMHIYPRSSRLHHTRRPLASSLFVGLGRCRARFGCTPLGPTNRPEVALSMWATESRHRHYCTKLQACRCMSTALHLLCLAVCLSVERG
jgi:hypothetical protein